jgi:hypothetical protein
LLIHHIVTSGKTTLTFGRKKCSKLNLPHLKCRYNLECITVCITVNSGLFLIPDIKAIAGSLCSYLDRTDKLSGLILVLSYLYFATHQFTCMMAFLACTCMHVLSLLFLPH